MSRKHLALVTALAALVALAFAASATSSGATAKPQGSPAAKGSTTTQVGTMSVRWTINRFVKRGNRLYAVGTAITQFTPTADKAAAYPTKTVRRAFTARVVKMRHFSSAKRICPILNLTLGPLDLNLLGLMVHLDRVHLTITADSNGGLLGSLLCGLSGQRATSAKAVRSLTRAAHRSGLSTKGVRVAVPLYQTTSGSGSTLSTNSASSPTAICSVLDLTLGPLDLNLLGLIVHLDTVHLTITADSEGGILGQLLCGLAGGGRASP